MTAKRWRRAFDRIGCPALVDGVAGSYHHDGGSATLSVHRFFTCLWMSLPGRPVCVGRYCQSLAAGVARLLKPGQGKTNARLRGTSALAIQAACKLGRRQVVRQRLLVPPFAGSNPAAPASPPSPPPSAVVSDHGNRHVRPGRGCRRHVRNGVLRSRSRSIWRCRGRDCRHGVAGIELSVPEWLRSPLCSPGWGRQRKPPIRVQARMGGIFSETLWTMPLSISCCRQAYDFDAQAPENRWARPPNTATGRKTVASAFHGANRISGEMSAGKMGRIGFRDPAQLGHVRSEA